MSLKPSKHQHDALGKRATERLKKLLRGKIDRYPAHPRTSDRQCPRRKRRAGRQGICATVKWRASGGLVWVVANREGSATILSMSQGSIELLRSWPQSEAERMRFEDALTAAVDPSRKWTGEPRPSAAPSIADIGAPSTSGRVRLEPDLGVNFASMWVRAAAIYGTEKRNRSTFLNSYRQGFPRSDGQLPTRVGSGSGQTLYIEQKGSVVRSYAPSCSIGAAVRRRLVALMRLSGHLTGLGTAQPSP